jgi:hypothetical protein
MDGDSNGPSRPRHGHHVVAGSDWSPHMNMHRTASSSSMHRTASSSSSYSASFAEDDAMWTKTHNAKGYCLLAFADSEQEARFRTFWDTSYRQSALTFARYLQPVWVFFAFHDLLAGFYWLGAWRMLSALYALIRYVALTPCDWAISCCCCGCGCCCCVYARNATPCDSVFVLRLVRSANAM